MNGHDHGDGFTVVDNVPYYTVNSATYVWCGSQMMSSDTLQEKYGHLHGICFICGQEETHKKKRV